MSPPAKRLKLSGTLDSFRAPFRPPVKCLTIGFVRKLASVLAWRPRTQTTAQQSSIRSPSFSLRTSLTILPTLTGLSGAACPGNRSPFALVLTIRLSGISFSLSGTCGHRKSIPPARLLSSCLPLGPVLLTPGLAEGGLNKAMRRALAPFEACEATERLGEALPRLVIVTRVVMDAFDDVNLAALPGSSEPYYCLGGSHVSRMLIEMCYWVGVLSDSWTDFVLRLPLGLQDAPEVVKLVRYAQQLESAQLHGWT